MAASTRSALCKAPDQSCSQPALKFCGTETVSPCAHLFILPMQTYILFSSLLLFSLNLCPYSSASLLSSSVISSLLHLCSFLLLHFCLNCTLLFPPALLFCDAVLMVPSHFLSCSSSLPFPSLPSPSAPLPFFLTCIVSFPPLLLLFSDPVSYLYLLFSFSALVLF